jgi:hypothetical protein
MPGIESLKHRRAFFAHHKHGVVSVTACEAVNPVANIAGPVTFTRSEGRRGGDPAEN